jgi:acetolactate synthase-1/2/3 large subunit
VNNAELIVKLLEERGVRWVFGIPSGPVLGLIEALRHSSIDYVLTANESSAGFMATTIGQLTGVPGVCVATVGPGATNLTTGVGAAWLDRAPVLAVTCNVPSAWLERRIQMRIDHHALFRPLTKATFTARSDDLAATLTTALDLACAEPPGPVHLDLPDDVGEAMAGASTLAAYSPPPPVGDLDAALAQLAEALAASRRPLLLTGLSLTRGRSAAQLLRFVERHNLPFVSTLHAKGMLPESHANWAGVLGRARRTDVQAFVDRADLIVTVGYDVIEINYEEWIGATAVIHLDREPADVGPSVRMALNAALDLDRLIARLDELPPTNSDWTAGEIEGHRTALDRALRPACSGLGPHQVIDLVREQLPSDGILAYDVGAHTHQIATQWRTDRPGTCLATNGWSSMGYGMPAAYAAKLVHPERSVIGVVGDGGFQMTVGELALARRLNLAVPIVVLNDGWLGLMKVKQERKAYPLAGIHLGDPVPSPAHYFGVPCRPASDVTELAAALEWARHLGGPSVIEAFIDVEPYSSTVYD